MPSEDPIADEVIAAVDALLEGRLDEPAARRLEELVCTDRHARQAYLRYVHMTCSIPPHVAAPAEPVMLGDDAAPGDEPSPAEIMSETVMMPALRADLLRPDAEPPPIVLPAAADAPRSLRRVIFTSGRHAAAAVALVAAGLGFALMVANRRHASMSSNTPAPTPIVPPATRASPEAPSPAVPLPQAVARLTALAVSPSEDAVLPRPGTQLFAGRALQLKSGTAAEITFANGVVAVVEGPASLTIADAGRVELRRGKLCARVPHEARWFRVASSALTVTDLGTEFGLSIDDAGVALTHVFEGRVSVALATSSPNIAPAVQVLGADQTMRCPIAGGRVESAPSLDRSFTRDIAKFTRPVPVHNTGAAAAEGLPDPYWTIAADSNDPSLVPHAATVAEAFSTYLPNTPASRWISTMAHLTPMPAGVYTFRSRFDLSGLDPTTATLTARVAADDEVRQVRVNGRPIHLPALGDEGRQYHRLHEFHIAEGFVEGINTVDFDVVNNKEEMAFRLEWEGTAAARVTR